MTGFELETSGVRTDRSRYQLSHNRRLLASKQKVTKIEESQ